MKIRDVFSFLDTIAPFDSCFEWDNSGLLIGNIDDNFNKGLVCLDITDEIIDECILKQCNLIISHHPVIFDKLSKITSDLLIYKLIQNNINVISLHTNLDVAETGVNFVLANIFNLHNLRCLKNNSSEYIGLAGDLDKQVSSFELAQIVKEKLSCKRVSYLNINKKINTVAICGGSGSAFVNDIIKHNIDAYITAEIKYNIWLYAKRKNITLIDAGHFNTENVICDNLVNRLNKHFNFSNFHVAQNNKDIIDVV